MAAAAKSNTHACPHARTRERVGLNGRQRQSKSENNTITIRRSNTSISGGGELQK
jgi:hypothetical protein